MGVSFSTIIRALYQNDDSSKGYLTGLREALGAKVGEMLVSARCPTMFQMRPSTHPSRGSSRPALMSW
jgi:hypothetical protein